MHLYVKMEDSARTIIPVCVPQAIVVPIVVSNPAIYSVRNV